MLIIGGISIDSVKSKRDRAWVRAELVKLTTKLFGRDPSFESIEARLCEFLWLDWILNDECRAFWAELESEF